MAQKAKGYVDCAYLPGGECDCSHQIAEEKCPSAVRGAIVCLVKGERAGANRAHACDLIIKAMFAGKYQRKAVT